ncbi:MAG: hypothetical protein R2813_09800 [Flavobacteriales bacterium]
MKKSEVLILVVPLLFILIGLGVFFKIISAQDYLTEYVYKQSFSGIVQEKYLDQNHAYQRLEIEIDETTELFGAGYWNGLYENCQVGDSIHKEPGNGNIAVYRNSKIVFTSSYNTYSGTRIINRFSDRRIN